MGDELKTQTRSPQRLSNAMQRKECFVLSRSDFVPAYLKTHEAGRLRAKVEAAQALLRSCKVCPRECEVDRWENQTGVCKTGRRARVSSALAHHGEEDCLRGWDGSGTIFFSGCNLGCVFCQNFEISQLAEGRELDAGQLAAVMLRSARGRLPQHQLRHPRARRAADIGGAARRD